MRSPMLGPTGLSSPTLPNRSRKHFVSMNSKPLPIGDTIMARKSSLAKRQASPFIFPSSQRQTPRRRAALASRILSICRTRMFMSVRPVSDWSITSRLWRMAKHFTATGPTHAHNARSRASARPVWSVGSHDGSTRQHWRRCRGAWMNNQK